MSEPKYKARDMVRIVEFPWNQHAGDYVCLLESKEINGTWVYEFVIPEQRGSVPEHLIERLVCAEIGPKC